MTQFEIIMRTDTPELPAEIGNFEEVKAAITAALTEYKTDVVITPDSVKDAEKVRASLRKAKEQIENYRKDAKAAYMDKFAIFEAQCKELSGLIDAPIAAIDGKIKEFEECERSKKLKELQLFYASINAPGWIGFGDVLPEKWKNKTSTIAKLKDEISVSVQNAVSEYAEIQRLYGESVLWTAINTKFMETKSKSQTLIYAAQLERQHSEEQKRAEAIQKAREAQERAMNGDTDIPCQTKFMDAPESAQNAHTGEEEPHAVSLPENVQNAAQGTADTSNAILSGAFSVECTADKLRALVQFMKQTGIRYAVIK